MNNGQSVNLQTKKTVFVATITVLFAILYFGFFRLQVSQSRHYSEKSLRNSIRVVTQIPVRGNIYDREGRLIVDNRPAFSIYLVPEQTTAETIRKIAEMGGIPEDKIREKLRRANRFQPVKVIRDVKLELLTWIQENVMDLPGVEWKIEPKRHYVFPSGLAHLLGTLGEIDQNELSLFPELEEGDIVGKKALERYYDSVLRGEKGFRYVKVDAYGRTVAEVSNKHSRAPYPGKDLFLTIDLRLQLYADTLLQGKRGAIVAVDPRSGEILTLISKPDYNLDWFTGVIDPKIWQSLLNDPNHPLYDRSYQSGYPPGSVFKLVTAVAALNEKIITPSWKVHCPGYLKVGRRTIRCWNAAGHGTLDLQGAIKNSCNVYFAKLGLLIGIDVFSKYARLFGFGSRTGVELTNENPGLVPDRKYYDKIYGKDRWPRGILANLAIGQGELLVTPLQVSQMVTIIANRGRLPQLHLGLKLRDPVTDEVRVLPWKKRRIQGIDSSTFEIVRRGMYEVVHGGTGWAAGIWGISVAGKTGTAQNPHGEPHAWFVGFAPYEQPEIAICVLIENGGSGGGAAAPLAGKYLRRYFYYHGKFSYEKERRMRALAAKRDSLRRAREDSLAASGANRPE